MALDGRFGLTPRQVPPPPQRKFWEDHLRWCLAVMDHDDHSLGITAGLLSATIERGSFTPRQQRAAEKILARVKSEWAEFSLDCQQEQPLQLVAANSDVESVA